ncbi:hypothetical protein HY972_02455 [Candidatus Kaiserbacteria bacterium]|nr:hypothetical protein [Candidatus Kaiserbacteria bacterium]
MVLISDTKPRIGFIGQGYIGKNYADDFERRGYDIVRYALEDPYRANKEKIASCDIVFIAVPTPTTPEDFDDSIVRGALELVGEGKIAVIKSTLKPGTTMSLQKEFLSRIVLHSPEFLSRATAAYDASHPSQNIIGIPIDDLRYRASAESVSHVLPSAPALVVSSNTSEFFKYVHNTSLFVKSVFMNLLYDTAQTLGVKWEDITDAIQKDPMLAVRHPDVSHWHITPLHVGGRGIGGPCHIKDFETFARLYHDQVGDVKGEKIIDALKHKNIALLKESGKDLDLLRGVYGDSI